MEKDEKAGFKPSNHHKYRVFRFVVIIPYGHSHVSFLIEKGFSAVAIAERVGHESIDITYRYAHMFPTKQTEMANKLDEEWSQKGGSL